MILTRRNLLATILVTASAPAIVRASSLMKLPPPKASIVFGFDPGSLAGSLDAWAMAWQQKNGLLIRAIWHGENVLWTSPENPIAEFLTEYPPLDFPPNPRRFS